MHIKDNQEYAAKIFNIERIDGNDQKSLMFHKISNLSIVKLIGINFKSYTNPRLLQPTIIIECLHHVSLKDNLKSERQSQSDIFWTVSIFCDQINIFEMMIL